MPIEVVVEPGPEPVSRRSRLGFAKTKVRIGSDNTQVPVDAVEVEDQVDALLRPGLGRERLLEVPPQVGVAGGTGAAVHVDDGVVAAVAIDEEVARAAEDFLRCDVAAVEGEAVPDVDAGPLVSGHKRPHEAG